MKEGLVLLIGRPNVGKSTFLNNIIGQKVAITSPKPQTTRMPIQGLYRDERGKIIFTDTPGIFDKASDFLAKRINESSLRSMNKQVDAVIYMIDPTRKRDYEEARTLGIVRKLKAPVILVFNKIDKGEKYLAQYKYLENEFTDIFHISALEHQHLKPLMSRIFELLPEHNPDEPSRIPDEVIYPLLSMDSRTFIAELIREKVFIMMGQEIPYTTTAIVDDIKERENGILYIRARILTLDDRYKRMLIGAEGRKIKEVGSYARKEIALATSKKVFLDLKVETDPHWQETYFGQ